jgi:GNAT superfamily N-acetyltransferase
VTVTLTDHGTTRHDTPIQSRQEAGMPRSTAPVVDPSTTDTAGGSPVAPRPSIRGHRRATARATPAASRAPARPPDWRVSIGRAPAGSPTDAVTISVHDVLWEDPAAAILRASMAAELRGRYADRLHDPTRRPSILDPVDPESVSYTAVAYADGEPVGHLALRRLRDDVDLKRMYVVPEWRGRGVSTALLHAAEAAADRLGVRRIVVQTGDRQPDAVHCYRNHGYHQIPVFAPDKAMTHSLCFAKNVCADAA